MGDLSHWVLTYMYWQELSPTDKYWLILRRSDTYWHALVICTDKYWQVLTGTDRYWQVLTSADKCWQVLTCADNYYDLLTLAETYLLTFTDMCWHIQYLWHEHSAICLQNLPLCPQRSTASSTKTLSLHLFTHSSFVKLKFKACETKTEFHEK